METINIKVSSSTSELEAEIAELKQRAETAEEAFKELLRMYQEVRNENKKFINGKDN